MRFYLALISLIHLFIVYIPSESVHPIPFFPLSLSFSFYLPASELHCSRNLNRYRDHHCLHSALPLSSCYSLIPSLSLSFSLFLVVCLSKYRSLPLSQLAAMRSRFKVKNRQVRVANANANTIAIAETDADTDTDIDTTTATHRTDTDTTVRYSYTRTHTLTHCV